MKRLTIVDDATHESVVAEMADGSIVHLNTRSQLHVRYSDDVRSLRLLYGQALFKVKRDAERPFIVYGGATAIQVLGAQFDVYSQTSKTRVAVLEDAVHILQTDASTPVPSRSGTPAGNTEPHPAPDVSTPKKAARLAAGEAADIAVDGMITRREGVDAAGTSAWRQRRLVFREVTLAEIAAEFNRYNASVQIRVIGAAGTAERFSGTFEADVPEMVMQALAADDTLVVEHRGREILIRAREREERVR